MAGSSSDWGLYLATTCGVSVLAWSLWSGKVSLRNGPEIRKAENPAGYWVVVTVWALLTLYLVKETVNHLVQ